MYLIECKERLKMQIDVEKEIGEIVNRETTVWDTQDVELLMTIFHPDMVWPWPPDPLTHDPMDWVLVWGRFNYARWKCGWQQLFEDYRLGHNHRSIRKIVISHEGDGAFAVVDVNTL
jgi:hypothetical protein